jgi:MYXO-CTERM domain-containing protein
MLRKSFLAAAVTLILGAAGTVQAQTCASDKDCPQGYACHSETVVAPTPGCKPGAECPPVDAGAPTVVSFCQAKSCNTDTDCGAGMVCFSQTVGECSGGTGVAAPACPPNQPCPDAGTPPKPPEDMCTTRTVKACAFKWQLPCNTSADCGAGFTCKPSVVGSCSGSGPTPGTGGSSGSGGGSGSTGSGSSGNAGAPAPQPDPGFAPPPTDAGAARPAPPMCMTMETFPGYCAPTVTRCNVDVDCPPNWKCTDSYDTPVASDPAPPPGSGAPVAPPRMDAGTPPSKMCTSIYGGGVPSRDSKGEVGGPTTGMGTGGGSNGGGTAPPAVPPTPSPSGGADAGTTASPKSSGCNFGGGEGASGAGLLLVALLGLTALRRRR